MLTIETKELEISLELKRKVEMICKFACAKATFKNGNIKSIKETNIAYVMPHIIMYSIIRFNSVLLYEYPTVIILIGLYFSKLKNP